MVCGIAGLNALKGLRVCNVTTAKDASRNKLVGKGGISTIYASTIQEATYQLVPQRLSHRHPPWLCTPPGLRLLEASLCPPPQNHEAGGLHITNMHRTLRVPHLRRREVHSAAVRRLTSHHDIISYPPQPCSSTSTRLSQCSETPRLLNCGLKGEDSV